jgi:hypothetical protein
MSGISTAWAESAFWLSWRPGPVSMGDGAVVVSLTDFRAHRLRDLPGIYWSGLRLREGWYAMPGAIGLWLWGRPLERGRGGSVSVWQSEADLRRFVGLPAHVAIMRKYRSLGTLNSATWEMDHFSLPAAQAAAQQRIGAWSSMAAEA